MRIRLKKALHLALLARLEQVLSAVSNLWLMVFIARRLDAGSVTGAHGAAWSLPVMLGLGGVVAGGLAIYGLALNDALDRRHDRLFQPQRPIAAGTIAPTTAVGLAVLCLLAAVLASLLMGVESAVICVVTAMVVLFYNTTAKFIPAAGLIALGLARAGNMFIPAPGVSFVWPVWLTMTHVMTCAVIAHVLEGKRPRLHPRDWSWMIGGWAFWTLALVGLMSGKQGGSPGLLHDRPGLWIGPACAVVVFVGLASWRLRGRMRPLRTRRAAGAEFMRVAMLWLIVYDAVWLLSAGVWVPGIALLAMFAATSAGLYVLSEARRWAEPSPGYHVGVTNPVTPGG
ncbi:MAG: hypothetical protein K8S99_09180 [Planctomycetes bacterium]|nr:hypothetical protein [Planctomycetota bacterium]